jgi:hypothetical protein
VKIKNVAEHTDLLDSFGQPILEPRPKMHEMKVFVREAEERQLSHDLQRLLNHLNRSKSGRRMP